MTDNRANMSRDQLLALIDALESRAPDPLLEGQTFPLRVEEGDILVFKARDYLKLDTAERLKEYYNHWLGDRLKVPCMVLGDDLEVSVVRPAKDE